MRIKLFNKLWIIRNPITSLTLPSINTFGITNRCEDGFFVFFADYDTVEYGVVKDDAKFLQKNYDLGTVITRISSLNYSKDNRDDKLDVGNYHIIGFSKFTFPQIKEMIFQIRCDEHFKRGYKYQARCWVLRLGEKKDINSDEDIKPFTIFKEVLPAKTKKCSSKALIELFEKIDNIELKQHFKKLDKSEEVEFINYQTK